MDIPGITWQGGPVDDPGLLADLPAELARLLVDTNGFILHGGAVHVRGACVTPDWHSLRTAWQGPAAFHVLYETVRVTDIPWAQDQFGDQFLLRDGAVVRLAAETGDIEAVAARLADFLAGLRGDVGQFLNVAIDRVMPPGHLLHAHPPFCFRESGNGISLQALPAAEVIGVHASLAKQIQSIPDGGKVELRYTE